MRGSIIFNIDAALNVSVRIDKGRFWSDSPVLKLGRFSDVLVGFERGAVEARIRLSIEHDGPHVSFDHLKLSCERMSVTRINGRRGGSIHKWLAFLRAVN